METRIGLVSSSLILFGCLRVSVTVTLLCFVSRYTVHDFYGALSQIISVSHSNSLIPISTQLTISSAIISYPNITLNF